MQDMKTIITNIRKILLAVLWAVAGLVLIFLDRATVGAVSRSIGTSLESFAGQGLDRLMSALMTHSGIIVEAIGAVRISTLIFQLVSLLMVAIPLFALLVIKPCVVHLAKAGASYKTSCASEALYAQDVYLLQDKFLC